ncbi:hypothetical protein FisN_34Lu051 [Fistulifera solaris]|uniref:CBM20 domain-containing protein n=1 Tax=Fistulifera solaris TaxID=1519565 RepID=A0A1Z5JHG1_FISSO|nr:hypothetical protein FisN_34Lu051 [Fistulifera solaris]|eukprot:GAX13443.1 hypothetical protein FisN_34Lu051 [Fistulifera solaris]
MINRRLAALLFALLSSTNAESIERHLAGRGTLNAKKAHSLANPIVVDGDITEWIKGDIFANMYRQGNADTNWKGYQLAAVAYKRVDCEKKQVCFLVLGEAGVEVEPSLDNSWFKDYNSGMPGDKYTGDPGIVFVKAGGKPVGWEGCFKIPEVAMKNPSRSQIEVHVNYKAGKSTTWDTGSTGKAQHGYTKMDLCLNEGAVVGTPVAAPVVVPVGVSVVVPVGVSVGVPVGVPVAAPVPVPVAAPVPVPVAAPVPVPVAAPVPVPVAAPVPVPVAAPVPVPVAAPFQFRWQLRFQFRWQLLFQFR